MFDRLKLALKAFQQVQGAGTIMVLLYPLAPMLCCFYLPMRLVSLPLFVAATSFFYLPYIYGIFTAGSLISTAFPPRLYRYIPVTRQLPIVPVHSSVEQTMDRIENRL